MKNKHVEYRRIVDGASVAVLMVHGILSTPNHFRELIPLVPKDYSVLAMVTDGHCGSVKDFSHSSLESWEISVQNAVDELLETHDEIYMVGYSLGTLLSIGEAIKNPKIKGLFLIAVPIKVRVRLRMIPMVYKIYTKRIKDDDEVTLALRESYGTTDSKNIFEYLGWIPRFLDLFKKISQTRKDVYKLETKCIAFQSMRDELVSPKSVGILKKESKMQVEVLDDSTHFYYAPSELDRLKQEFIKFLS
jgi:carboxylesterase